jgi:hypothetical protein
MRKTINTLFILFLILTGSGVFAQDPSSPGEDPGLEAAPINNFIIPTQDPPSPGEDPGLEAALINNFIIPMLLLGIVLGYRLLSKVSKVKSV